MKNVYALCAMWLLLVGCQEDLSNEMLSSDEITEPVGEAVMLLNSTPELEAIIAKGRKVFQENCNMCHSSPDAFGLANFDFKREDIIRRAIEHITSEEAESIADMVEAVRQKYNITPADPRKTRLFQSGNGEVLAGDTPHDRDFNFLKNELPRWSPTIVSGVADTRELALQVRDELAAIDLQQMNVGIPFPLWSSDPHHGEGTVDEWLSNLPCFTENKEAYGEVQQAYLDNPNQETFMRLLKATDEYTSCSDNLERVDGPHPVNGKELGGQTIARNKYYAQLVADYCMRQQAMGNNPLQPDLAFPWMSHDRPLGGDLGGRGRFKLLSNHIWAVNTIARKTNFDPSLASGKYDRNSVETLLETMGYDEFTVEGQQTGINRHYLSDQMQTSWFWCSAMFDNQQKTDYLISATEQTGYPGHARLRQGHTQLAYFGDWSWSGKGTYYPNFYYTQHLDKDFEGQPQEYKELYSLVEMNIAWATLYSTQEYISSEKSTAYKNDHFNGMVKAAWAVYLRGGDYEKAKELVYDSAEKSFVKAGYPAAEGRAKVEELLERQAAGSGHHHGHGG